MIQPVNGHLLIEPIKQDTFIANQNDTYEEIGVVINADVNILGNEVTTFNGTYSTTATQLYGGKVSIGDKVYFDAWLAAKFPNGKEGFYWLVKWEDVRAVENAKSEPIPE